MHTPDLKNFLHEDMIEAGCDEAGRGPLAGPVFAASVILPKDFFHPLLDDSKKMTAAHRDKVREVIEKEAVAWAVEEVSPAEIDELNILWASVTGMQRAVLRLDPKPEFLLIDGNKSAVRLGTEHGLPYPGAHCRHQEIRLHPLSPHVLPPQRTRAHTV